VDDERDNRELLGVILAWEGFVVVTAASGEEALATVAQHRPT
jgi:CheY-like chemotaxis protein